MKSIALVPALALAVGLAPSLHAVDVGGLTIGGFVDTWLEITDVDEAESTVVDFAAEIELQFGYKISDTVSAQIDIEFNGTDSYLETALISWQLSPTVTLSMGEFVDWLGWEAADAPGRYRFDRTFLVSQGNFYGIKSVTGLILGFKPMEGHSGAFFIVDEIYGGTQESDELGFGFDYTVDVEGFGSVNVELAYDQGAADAFGGDAEEDVFALGVNATYTGTENVVAGGELHFLDFDAASSFGLMLMANYKFDPKASGTIMVAYLEPNDDVDDDEGIEIAAAVLTTPIDDPNFALNFELKYQMWDDANPNGNADTISFYIEMLAIIP